MHSAITHVSPDSSNLEASRTPSRRSVRFGGRPRESMLPSGACSRQVREWLGMPDDEPVDELSTASDPFIARPARWAGPTRHLLACVHSLITPHRHRLGLGAKFLSHAQATALSPAERKLQAGIKGPAGKRSAADMQKRGGPKELDRAKPSDDASGSSSDEEESRTSTFKWARLAAHSTSHELLASLPAGLPPCTVRPVLCAGVSRRERPCGRPRYPLQQPHDQR